MSYISRIKERNVTILNYCRYIKTTVIYYNSAAVANI